KVDPDTGKITIPADKIEDGSEVTAKTEDKAGNVSDEGKVVAGSGIEFSPAITSVVDDVNTNAKDSTGDVKGAKTNDNKPEIKGNIGVEKSGVEVTIYDNGKELGKATTNDKGEFSFTPSTALTDGKHEFVAKATDEKGEKSSSAVSVDVDTQVISDLAVNGISGDNTLNQVEAMFDQVVSGKISGEFKAGDKVEVTTANGKTFSSALDKDGNFAIKIPGADLIGLQNGEKLPLTQDKNDIAVNVKVTAHDDAGNEKVVTKVHNFNYDFYDLEAPKITAIVDNVAGGKTGELANNDLTNDSTPTIKGTISDQVLNATKEMQIFDGDKLIGTATAVEKTDTNGKRYGEFEFTSPALKDGTHNISVKAVDVSGNTSNASNTFTINVDTKVGVEVKPDGQIIITNAENGIKPTISIGGKDVSVVEKNGKFYIPTESLANGKNVINVSVTDKAGNTASVATEADFTKHSIEIPSNQVGFTGHMWSWAGAVNQSDFRTFNTDVEAIKASPSQKGKYNHAVNLQGAYAITGDPLGTTHKYFKQETNTTWNDGLNHQQVYSFKATTLIQGAKVVNGKTKLVAQPTQSFTDENYKFDAGDQGKIRVAIKVDGQLLYNSDWIYKKTYIDLPIDLNGKHNVEIIIGLDNSDLRGAVGIANEKGEYSIFGKDNGSLDFNTYTKDFSQNSGVVYDSTSNTFVKEVSSQSAFKAVSSKTAHDIDGTDGVETINGTNDGDYIDAKGGADTINAGKGDDVVVFDTKDVKVDGGDGRDTLLVKESIDFTKIQNLDSKVENFEVISLGEKATDSVSITLDKVNVADILDNQVVNGKPTNNVLEIIGDSNDKVTLKGFTEVTDSLKTGVNGFEKVTDASGRTNDTADGANVSAEPVGALNNQADKLSKLLDTETNRVFKTTTSDGQDLYVEVNKLIDVKLEDNQ
ncbi:Ig-like domain-containing protein, partial [Campylobacter gastrosuis]